ncbi:hypothetical protein KKA14_21435, partial [bacterium]|nr:hypothetical protein [bacterium]
TGHVGIYVGDNSIDYSKQVDVNTEGYSVSTDSKTSAFNICNNTGHMEIDDCANLKSIIQKIIYKRAGYSY